MRTTHGNSKADLVARPSVAVVIAADCKYSSSKVNSHKRLVKEMGNKATQWRLAFGPGCVPVAVLGGVFRTEDVLLEAVREAVVRYYVERVPAADRSAVLRLAEAAGLAPREWGAAA